ncbi:MAG: LacI family DNA-binding transcriptional regulator, partial [Lachnospiraceae bacterium]|nr:LacI family DNA-binding transcriptional regulator [Lachnospiraceae bacterium]
MVSIKDIAEKAGVSRGTVDRVLHERGRVSEETAQRIRALAEEMDYSPSEAGMALAAHKKKIRLGFIYV